MTLTRDPSARRASTIGDDSSTRRPIVRHDLVDDVHQVRVVLEADVGVFQHARALDVNLVVPVDQDVVDGRVLQQGLQRAQPEHFVQHFQRQALPLPAAHRCLQVRDQILNHGQGLARVRSSRTVATLSRSTLFSRSRCTLDFNSWYTLKFSPDCFFSSPIEKALRPLEGGVIGLISAMFTPPVSQTLIGPTDQGCRYGSSSLPGRLFADGSGPFVEISCYLGTGSLAERVAPTDRLQHLNVLIRHFPENLLANNLLDLRFVDNAPVLVPVKNHAKPVCRYLLPSKVIRLPYHIAQRRNFGDGDNIDLIAIPDQFKMFVVQSRREVDQNEGRSEAARTRMSAPGHQQRGPRRSVPCGAGIKSSPLE